VLADESSTELSGSEKDMHTQLQKNTDTFYDSLKAKSDSNWLLKIIYPLVFNADSTKTFLLAEDTDYEKFRGKVIRQIEILNLDVFPPDSSEWQKPAYSLLSRLGNKIHLNSRKWVIQENLFFHEGDYLIPGVFRRNLIYLRNINYISDVRLMVISTENSTDSVDVVIIIRDKFSITLGGQFTSVSKFRLKIDDQNLFGLGRQFRSEWHINTKQRGSIGWESFYNIPNIRGSFIQGMLNWADLCGYNRLSAALNRPFLFPVIRSTGGAEIAETRVSPPADSISVNRIELGGWSGYCIQGSPGPVNQYAYAALSLKQKWFQKRPKVGSTFGKLWHESLMAIGSLALTQSDYQRFNHVYSFPENEDIPVGFLIEFLFGEEFGEYHNREFVGFQGAWGDILQNNSYFYLKGGLDSFIKDGNPEQGVCVLESMYITPLKKVNRIIMRTFYKGKIIIGYKRLPEEKLKLSADPYFRGNHDLSGTRLIALNIEKNYLAPWELLGFQFEFFGFIDGALVTRALFTPEWSDVLFTEGAGFRLHNPHLIWKFIEFQVAWNQSKEYSGALEFSISTKLPFKITDFEGRRPEPYFFH